MTQKGTDWCTLIQSRSDERNGLEVTVLSCLYIYLKMCILYYVFYIPLVNRAT